MMTKHLKMIQVGKSPSRVVTQLKHYAFVYHSVDATISRWFSLFCSSPPLIYTHSMGPIPPNRYPALCLSFFFGERHQRQHHHHRHHHCQCLYLVVKIPNVISQIVSYLDYSKSMFWRKHFQSQRLCSDLVLDSLGVVEELSGF